MAGGQLPNKLGANLTSYYAFELEPALEGVAAAGYRYVELASIRGVVEHVPLDADAATIDRTSRLLAKHGLAAIGLGGHSDLTTEAGLRDGRLAVDLCERLGVSLLTTAVGGVFNENEDEALFLAGIDDFAKLLATLAESGYAGAFSVEIEGQLGVKPQLEQINEAMRQSRELLAEFGLG